MRYGFLNNFSQSLAADLLFGDTTMTLLGGGALMANASVDFRYKLTLVQTDLAKKEINREIVDVIGAAGDVLTIERRKEGTTSLSPWPSGTKVYSRVTAEQMESFKPELISFGPVDFSDIASSATWVAPPGKKLFVDSIEVIPSASGNAGGWTVDAGTPTLVDSSYDVSYSPDDSLLAIVHDTTPFLTVLNTSDWTTVAGTPTLPESGYGVDFNHDGTLLAVAHWGSPYVTVIETSGWTTVTTPVLSGTGNACAFSPDGSLLAIASDGSPYLTVFETTGWTVVTTPALTNLGKSLAWSPDGAHLAAGHWSGNRLTILETTGWTVVSGTPAMGNVANAVAYSPDSTLLAVGYGGGDTLDVYQVSDWSKLTIAANPVAGSGSIYALAWSPDSSKLAAGYDRDINLKVLETSGWTSIPAFGLTDNGQGLEFDSTSSQLAAAHWGTPFLTVGDNAINATPTLNLGETSGAPTDILNGASLEQFAAGSRIVAAANHKLGVSSLYAEPGVASDAGTPATLVVKGYTTES